MAGYRLTVTEYLTIVLTTAAKKLKVIKLDIQWIGPGAVQEKMQLTLTTRLHPSLVEDHLVMIDWLQMVDDQSLSEFTTLQVLPSMTDSTGSSAVPLIIGARARISDVAGFEMTQTIVDRWECVEYRPSLPTVFEEIGNRRTSIPTAQALPVISRLRRLEPLILNKVIVNMYAFHHVKLLVFVMSDGTVEYRDRFTFEELYTNMDDSRIMNLHQVGWMFSEEGGPCYQAAFSPTQCSMVQMGDDGRLKWSKLIYPQGDMGDSNADAVYAGSVAGLSIAVAGSIFGLSNFDDILAIAHPLTQKQRFAQDWVQELIRILKVQVDYTDEAQHDMLIRNPTFHSCMSIMNNLGYRGDRMPRTFQSIFANICLQIRTIVIITTLACNAPLQAREKMSPLDEPDVIELLAGELKWSQDLLAWILDCLFDLMQDSQFMETLTGPRLLATSEFLQEKKNVALHLLLSSSSRGLLSVLCRRILQLDSISSKAVEYYGRQASEAKQCWGEEAWEGEARLPCEELQMAYQKLQQVINSSMVPVGEFEKMLNMVSSEVKQTYATCFSAMVKQAGQTAPQGKQLDMLMKSSQSQMEMAMLLTRPLPAAFGPLVKKLFGEDLGAIEAKLDRAELFFADYTALGGIELRGTDLAECREAGVGPYFDVFRRVELEMGVEGGKPWRRCVRCPAVMENVTDMSRTKPALTFLLAQHRKCVCGGSWGLIRRRELVL